MQDQLQHDKQTKYSFHNSIFSSLIILILVLLSGLYSKTAAQITITQDQIQQIFTVGQDVYYSRNDATVTTVDIGAKGGPNIYQISDSGMPRPWPLHNFDVSTIPVMASRFPSNSITMGTNPDSIQNNVFHFGNNILDMPGAISTYAQHQVRQKVPYESLVKFPFTYGQTANQSFTQTDTFFTQNWVYTSTQSIVKNKIAVIDGYGTLKIGSFSYECLRMKMTDDNGNKQFFFFTREGLLMVIDAKNSSEPDAGVINIDGMEAFLFHTLMAVGDENNFRPSEFSLSQNYPNPFNPTSTINYSVAKAGPVSLKIYNSLGETVATLADGYKAAGNYSATINLTKNASGIYFCRMEAGAYSTVRKIMLLK